MLSKKLLVSVLAISIASSSAVFAGLVEPRVPTRWEKFVYWTEAHCKYILPASGFVGAVAGLAYLTVPTNQAFIEKLPTAGKLAISSAVISAEVLGLAAFGITESLD